MRILIYGAGAVGNFLGAHLALTGHQVTLLGRERMAEAIDREGLSLKQANGEMKTAAPLAVSSIDQALSGEPYNWIAFSMKAYDTVEAIYDLQSRLPSPPPIVSFQNGVGNEESIRSAFGEESVVAATLTTPVSMADSNTVIEEKARGAALASDSPHAKMVASSFEGSALRLDVTDSAANLKWSKLLLNMIANATSAILDMPPAEALRHPGIFRTEVLALREALAMMDLQNIKAVNLPGAPTKLLAAALRTLPIPILRPLLYRQVAGGRGDKLPSLLVGLRSGRKETEAPWLNGAVAQAATNMKRLTPINHGLALLVSDIATGRVAWESYQRKPEMLLAAMRIAEGMPR